jgi:hypothetical protein
MAVHFPFCLAPNNPKSTEEKSYCLELKQRSGRVRIWSGIHFVKKVSGP